MKKFRVWGGIRALDSGQHRVIVGAISKRQVAGIVGLSVYIINKWWAETRNETEVKKATEQPYTMIDMGKI